MNDRYIALAVLKAKEGKRKNLQEELLKLIEPTRKEKGCLEYLLFEDKNENGIFYMREAFENKTAFDEHLSSDYFQNFESQLEELLLNPIQLIELVQISH
jgi:quinol monooxygenase YgiN